MPDLKTIQEVNRHEQLREDALKLATEVMRKKIQDYGHWLTYPEVVLAAQVYTKSRRLLELTIQRAANPDIAPKNEPMLDSCIDLINYASYLHSVRSFTNMRAKGGGK